MQLKSKKFSVRLDFEAIKLPPVTDILVLGCRVPQGKHGVISSMEFLAPDSFEMIEITNDVSADVDAIIVNKAILKRMPRNQIIDVLKENVFPYVGPGEAIRVNFSINIECMVVSG
jgi:hypothetical protein